MNDQLEHEIKKFIKHLFFVYGPRNEIIQIIKCLNYNEDDILFNY